MSEQPPQESYTPYFDVPMIVMGIILGMLLVAALDHYSNDPPHDSTATTPATATP